MPGGRRSQSWGTDARVMVTVYSLVVAPSSAVTVTVMTFSPPDRSTSWSVVLASAPAWSMTTLAPVPDAVAATITWLTVPATFML